MPIIQISKIQQRSGNLVDLPQLDEAQFGFAADAKRVFIGKTSGNSENIEVLTSYSNISFSQILGSDGGNFNISNAQNGQILTFVDTTNTWENWPNEDIVAANSNFKVDFGDVAYLKMTGNAGAGFVLETDGLGNLSWTPKGVVTSNIANITANTTAIVTTQSDHYLTDAASITITDVAVSSGSGNNFTKLNGGSFYANVLTSNTFALYSDSALTTPVDTSTGGGNTQVYTANSGQLVSAVGGSGSTLIAAGANSQLQYNLSGTLAGTSMLTYGGTGTLTHSGPAIVAGNVYANSGTIGAGTLNGNLLSVVGNANIGNIGTAGLITATGNIRGANLVTSGVLSVTGNANIGNIGTGGLITATGNITGGNLVTANANIGNIGTAGLITATGNVTAGNISTAGLITATGNITGGNLVTGGALSVTANANIGNIGTAGLITATGNLNAGNIITAGIMSSTGNATHGNISTAGLITATGNITGANLVTAGVVSASGNATVLGIKTDNYYYANGASISFAGTYSNSNVASYLPTFTGTVGATAITTGANTTAGTVTGNWTLTAGSRFNATYADLAEYYEADQVYEPGTVLEFGGDKEVTIAEDGTSRVAGVVSTDPAYAMNTKCPGIAVAIALQGRVPCKVRGTIHKGDMMISGGNGYARPTNSPQMGTVIGKALENFNGDEGVIEIAVGRL
jgi:filamentous hemagglutinin